MTAHRYCPFPALELAFPGIVWADYSFDHLFAASRRLAMSGPSDAHAYLTALHRPPKPRSIDDVVAGWPKGEPPSDELKNSPPVTGADNEWWNR